jgi:hypothetical protein
MNTLINWHSIRIIALVVATIVVNGWTVITGVAPDAWQSTLGTILPFLIVIEHALGGGNATLTKTM